jgi:hypothetical protein
MPERSKTIEMGHGVFITLSVDTEDKPSWINITAGSSGSDTAATSNAISNLMNEALQKGSEIEILLSCLRGIGGLEPWWSDGVLIGSIPDAIAVGVEELLKEFKKEKEDGDRKLQTQPS